jgi:HD-GYP domain-containing protein (c-di-GMP phosphodiesterase class II)
VSLAEVVDRTDEGAYRLVRFSRKQIDEIKYAGLLHDFGKVGVREQVLVKAKKLYAPNLDLIRHRHAYIRRTLESDFWRRRATHLESHGRDGYEAFVAELESTHSTELAELDRFLDVVIKANEPSLLPEGSFEDIKSMARRTYAALSGDPLPFLTDDEVRFLTIRKGSLDETERMEIESHVTHTYDFLKQIPWTQELGQIPVIARGHHEKLDGTGYPKHIAGDDIPIQTRMMTISDIYDALTAQDRPYKPAVAPQRALDILTHEVNAGQLDAELFRLFVEGKVFETAGA